MSELFEKGIPGQMGEHYAKGPEPVPGQQAEPAEAAPPTEFGEEPVTDEEQAVYEQFVTRALQYMSGNAGRIIHRMNDPEVPVYQNVGKQGLFIAENVAKLAKSAGQEIDMNIMQAAGEEIIEGLMEMGDAAGIFPFGQDSDEYDESMAMAYMYGHELKAKEMIEAGDPEVKQGAENLLAGQIAKERQAGQVPDEFYDTMQQGAAEAGRRNIFGVE